MQTLVNTLKEARDELYLLQWNDPSPKYHSRLLEKLNKVIQDYDQGEGFQPIGWMAFYGEHLLKEGAETVHVGSTKCFPTDVQVFIKVEDAKVHNRSNTIYGSGSVSESTVQLG